MTDDKKRLIELLVREMPELTAGQLHWLQRVVHVFSADHDFRLSETDLFDEITLQNFGDAIRIHHSFSSEPFSKDKFEYVLVSVLKMSGHTASLASKCNPGHDATTDGVRLSLKTQADKGIRENILWISKYMELGKGVWSDNPNDLVGLRKQFLEHMKAYDRILTLRTLKKGTKVDMNS
jgi:type II restriction enzyme